jgi:hypothetical protein
MFVIEVLNKTGMEGFTRDLSNMVSSKNPLMVALNINHSGELRAIDGSDLPRNNQRADVVTGSSLLSAWPMSQKGTRSGR